MVKIFFVWTKPCYKMNFVNVCRNFTMFAFACVYSHFVPDSLSCSTACISADLSSERNLGASTSGSEPSDFQSALIRLRSNAINARCSVYIKNFPTCVSNIIEFTFALNERILKLTSWPFPQLYPIDRTVIGMKFRSRLFSSPKSWWKRVPHKNSEF